MLHHQIFFWNINYLNSILIMSVNSKTDQSELFPSRPLNICTLLSIFHQKTLFKYLILNVPKYQLFINSKSTWFFLIEESIKMELFIYWPMIKLLLKLNKTKNFKLLLNLHKSINKVKLLEEWQDIEAKRKYNSSSHLKMEWYSKYVLK